MCWAFELVPSRLGAFFWTVTYKDLKTKLKLRVEFEQTKFMQDFETMAKLMAVVFGGKKGGRPKNLVVPKTVAELKAAFASVINPASVITRG